MSFSSLRFHNTLTGRKEDFQPLQKGEIKMYVCGITPYDESHLGHARCYVFFDTVRRFFKACGFKVTCVQNFTDIDDKIIARAHQSNQDTGAVAERYIRDYFQKMALLNVKEADACPRVTESVPRIVQFIKGLMDRGLAYEVDGNVYYSVRKFETYGKLSKRTLEEMESGARVEIDERKKDPLDFALWKKSKENEPSWESPWSRGRPGWHIECSVMSINHLGESFDIHGGGQDLIFPHHENEIAQSEGMTEKPFARYWIHNGFVTVNREKMSKSLGNFFTLGEIFEKVSPEVVRLFLLSRHYRTPLDFSDDLLEQSRSAYHTLSEMNELSFFLTREEKPPGPLLKDWEDRFMETLGDDFNTEKAVAVVFQLRSQMIEKIKAGDIDWLKKARATFLHFLIEVLGVPLKSNLTMSLIDQLKDKLDLRESSRKRKDWEKADLIREEISSLGYLIEDTPSGPAVKSKA